MDELTEKKVKKLKTLKQYKDKTEEEILEIIESKKPKSLESTNKQYVDREEELFAEELYNKYLNEVQIETSSDKSDLDTLVYLEVLSHRTKKFLTDESKETGANDPKMIQKLIDINTEIRETKTALGLNKKNSDSQSGDQVIESLKKRFHTWINQPENRANYTLKCPGCKKTILIRRRLDLEKDEILEHPWFVEGGILFNKEVWKLFDEGTITDERVAKILNVSVKDYREWIYKHYKIEKEQCKKG
jgi:hypothetical protein